MKEWIKDFLAVVLFGSFCLFSSGPHAGQLNKDSADVIYALAVKISKLPEPEEGPVVQMLEAPVIDKLLTTLGVCPKGCSTVKAAQLKNVVVVSKALDFDSPIDQSILLHEFVHYLQWAKSGDAKTCKEWVDREIVAYQMQNLFLHKLNVPLVQSPAWPKCK